MYKVTLVEVDGAREPILVTVMATSEQEARRAAYEIVYGVDPEDPPTEATIEQYTKIRQVAAKVNCQLISRFRNQ